jgi:hypothetical protein
VIDEDGQDSAPGQETDQLICSVAAMEQMS